MESPAWDAEGVLWLKRDGSAEEADKDFLGVKVYAVIEDGIPLWLRTQIELVVSGKSREEEIGSVLPEGWRLAAVDSALPVAVDDAGRMKVQVRTGKWTVQLDAFRLDNLKEFRYPPDAKPAVADELIAFRARPDFRMVEIVGATSDRCLANDLSGQMAQSTGLSMADGLAISHRGTHAWNGCAETRGTDYRPRIVA